MTDVENLSVRMDRIRVSMRKEIATPELGSVLLGPLNLSQTGNLQTLMKQPQEWGTQAVLCAVIQPRISASVYSTLSISTRELLTDYVAATSGVRDRFQASNEPTPESRLHDAIGGEIRGRALQAAATLATSARQCMERVTTGLNTSLAQSSPTLDALRSSLSTTSSILNCSLLAVSAQNQWLSVATGAVQANLEMWSLALSGIEKAVRDATNRLLCEDAFEHHQKPVTFVWPHRSLTIGPPTLDVWNLYPIASSPVRGAHQTVDTTIPTDEFEDRHRQGFDEQRYVVQSLVDGSIAAALLSGNAPSPASIRTAIEQTLRTVVHYVLQTKYGEVWWERGVPETIRAKAENRYEDDVSWRLLRPKTGTILLGKTDLLDLRDIILRKSNWLDGFDAVFDNRSQITVLINEFNAIRRVEAHSNMLLPAESVKLVAFARELSIPLFVFLKGRVIFDA